MDLETVRNEIDQMFKKVESTIEKLKIQDYVEITNKIEKIENWIELEKYIKDGSAFTGYLPISFERLLEPRIIDWLNAELRSKEIIINRLRYKNEKLKNAAREGEQLGIFFNKKAERWKYLYTTMRKELECQYIFNKAQKRRYQKRIKGLGEWYNNNLKKGAENIINLKKELFLVRNAYLKLVNLDKYPFFLRISIWYNTSKLKKFLNWIRRKK